MATVKREVGKQKWEETEFPLVCETCLGDNAYVRMTKEAHGKKCKICESPFTVFAWQAGTKGRLKKVEICKTCAQSKNVCQVCIYDLQYGLPVKVRDRILKENGATSTMGAVPQSNANRAWYTAQQERLLENGQTAVGDANAMAKAQLESIARMEPRYERNLPKLCSFFARGECNRGDTCPFRHEMPRDRNDPLSKQNTKDRFYGTKDPVAAKLYARMKAKEEAEREKDDGKQQDDGFERARATLYLRFQGDAPYPPAFSEEAIRDQFYSFGEIVSVRPQLEKGQAFVEYTQPEATELAIATMNRKTLLDRKIYVAWARAPKRGNAASGVAVHSGQTDRRKQKGQPAPMQGPIVQPAPPTSTASHASRSGTASIPKGLVVKPSAEVAAIAAARRAAAGGGPIRRVGAAAAKRIVGNTAPYYPSSDPGRLGSRADASKKE